MPFSYNESSRGGLIKIPGAVGDRLFWRLARVHQGSVRDHPTALSVFRLTKFTFVG